MHDRHRRSGPLQGVKYLNVQTAGQPKELTVEAKAHNVAFTTSGQAACILAGYGSSGTGVYESKVTARAFKDPINGTTGAQVGVEVNP